MSQTICTPCEPPSSTTNLNDFSVQADQFVQELLTPVAGVAILVETPIGPTAVLIFINGLFQQQGVDYTVSGSTITFIGGLTPSWIIMAVYWKASAVVP